MRATGTAFASDFDGTLCESDWERGVERYDERILKAVRDYQAAGGLFGICTGRPLEGVRKSLEGLLELDFYIVTTGAQVLGRNLEIWNDQSVDRAVAQRIWEEYGRGDGVSMLAVTDEDLISIGEPLYEGMVAVGSIDQIDGELLGVSLEYHGDEVRARDALLEINERYAGCVEGFQNLGSVDIVHAGCSKGAGVHIAKEHIGVDTIVGIGDSYNDLPLLRAADVSYTFHASPAEVRAAADHVVADLAEALADFRD